MDPVYSRISQIRGRAHQLKHKSCVLNGMLKKKMKQLHVAGDRERLAELQRFHEVLRCISRKKGFAPLEELAAMGRQTERELDFINEQIDAELANAYHRIFALGTIPPGLQERLESLFERWDGALAIWGGLDSRLDDLTERLAHAEALCERLLDEKETVVKGLPRQKVLDSDFFEKFEPEERRLLMDLLRSIMVVHSIQVGKRLGIKLCCSRVAGYRFANAFGFYARKGHPSKSLRSIKRHLENCARRSGANRCGFEGPDLFNHVVRMYNEVAATVPPEMKDDEKRVCWAVQAFDVLMPEYIALKERGIDPFSILREKPPMELEAQAKRMEERREQIRDCKALPKFLLLDLAAPTLDYMGFDILNGSSSAIPSSVLENEEYTQLLAALTFFTYPCVYTRKEVDDLFELFQLPDEMWKLISPLNFILEDKVLIRSSEDIARFFGL